MRRATFILITIASAFVAGRATNGSGFRWVQSRILNYMGLEDGKEIYSVDLIAASPKLLNNAGRIALSADGDAQQGSMVNASSKSAKVSELTTGTRSKCLGKSSILTSGKSSSDVASLNPLASRWLSSLSPAVVPTQSQQQLETRNTDNLTELACPAPLDASVGPALLAGLTSNPSVSEHYPKQNTVPLHVTSSTILASTHFLPTRQSEIRSEGSSSALNSQNQWSKLRQKLQELGVAQYTINGSSGGGVIFVCVIPLMGQQAISERFEAYGDDEFLAVQIAIRRIILRQVLSTTSKQSH